MKFSIITCTYNSESWLKRNIDSVCGQSCQDFEHIFIDAFSKDSTVEIIKRYQNSFPHRVKLFQLEPKGISHAMNEGVRRAVGEYLIHLHSDDSFYDSKLLEDVRNFLNNKKPDWIYGKINVIEEDGRSLGTFPNRKIFQTNSKNKFGQYLLKFFNYIPHQAVFIKKTVFDNYGYFNTNLSSAMDVDFWLKIKDKTNWAFFNRIISNFCVRSGSQSASSNRIEENKSNYYSVQKAHLNGFESIAARVVNWVVYKKYKYYR